MFKYHSWQQKQKMPAMLNHWIHSNVLVDRGLLLAAV
jgi:hypothetical protein